MNSNQQVRVRDDSQDRKNKKSKKGNTVKGAIIGITMGLGVSAIVGLSVALYYANQTIYTHKTYQRQMDAVYSRAYYDLMDGASDLGINLRKIGVSNSPRMQQSLLYEVWSSASLAENSLSLFESNDDGLLQAQKFVNQLGDYSHSLAMRVANGEPLSAEERSRLIKMGDMADAYMKALRKVGDGLDEGKLFVGEGGALEGFADAFAQFSEPSFEYPEMIYDGPFSDSLEHREPVALTGDEISNEDAVKNISRYFDDYKISDINFAGEGEGDIPTFNYSMKIDGKDSFVQISKRGGALVAFNMITTDDAQQAVKQEAGPTCQQNALEFAAKLGFENMQVVWSSSANGECYINLAPVENDIILYSDLVKVKVRERDSRVIGLDATHYAYNHRPRKLPAPAITLAQATEALSLPAISEGRLALIPLHGARETLTYEFECHQNGTYFVYIDAQSGDEANILFVVDDGNEGNGGGMGMRTV